MSTLEVCSPRRAYFLAPLRPLDRTGGRNGRGRNRACHGKPQDYQCLPSPFSESVRIGFLNPGQADLSLEVFDVAGHRVYSDEPGSLPAGQHELHWNGCNDMGEMLFPGYTS